MSPISLQDKTSEDPSAKSDVLNPFDKTLSIAVSKFSAAFYSFNPIFNIMEADKCIAIGFAMFLTAISGA